MKKRGEPEEARARAFLLSFAQPGQRNRPADLALRALGAVYAAFVGLERGKAE